MRIIKTANFYKASEEFWLLGQLPDGTEVIHMTGFVNDIEFLTVRKGDWIITKEEEKYVHVRLTKIQTDKTVSFEKENFTQNAFQTLISFIKEIGTTSEQTSDRGTSNIYKFPETPESPSKTTVVKQPLYGEDRITYKPISPLLVRISIPTSSDKIIKVEKMN